MAIAVACVSCQQSYTLDDQWAGKQIRCRMCRHVIAVPALSTPAPQPQTKVLTDRIARLEELVARLQKNAGNPESKKRERTATFSPDGKAIVVLDDKAARVWQVPQAALHLELPAAQPIPVPNVPARPIPPGWKPREFNGLTYYMTPLAESR